MQKHRFFHRRSAVALAVVAASAFVATAHAESLVGLTTTNALLTFDSASPTFGSSLTPISGLAANERILSIDLRPTTGVLYGVSSLSRVYSLTTGGASSLIGTITGGLGSDVIGIDFNPVADLSGMTSLRIVSSTGQNFAFNVDTRATVIATGVQSGIASVAYSNNDVNPATATSLYYIDTAADRLLVANGNFNGAPAPVPISFVGGLGLDVGSVNGFDISGSSGTAFAAMTTSTGMNGLYTINLASGAATLAGSFGIGGNTAVAPQLLGLTVAAVPEPSSYAMMVAGLLGVGWVARRRRAAR